MNSAMFVQTNSYLDNLKREFPNHAPLALLYMWDIIRDTFEEVSYDPASYDVVPADGVTLETVWDKFIKYPWGGFDVEQLDVVNWLSAEDLTKEWDGETGSV